jgi:hypothetical protein
MRFLFFLMGLSLLSETVMGTVAHRWYRFEPTRLRGEGSENSIQLAEFELRRNGTRIPDATATNPGGDNPDGTGANPFVQTPDKAVDDDLQTKWLDFNKGPLVLDFGEPVEVDAYAFATAEDAPDRDPMGWTLYGSNDGTSWTVLDYRSYHNTTLDRNTWVGPFQLDGVPNVMESRFDLVATTGALAPGESVPFLTLYGCRLTPSGEVLVNGGYSRDGGAIAEEAGVYLWDGAMLSEVEAEDLSARETTAFVGAVSGRINDSGDVFLYETIGDTLNDTPDYGPEANERIVAGTATGKITYVREGRTSVAGYADYQFTNVVKAGFTNKPLTDRWRVNEAGQLAFYGQAEKAADDRFVGVFIADGNTVEIAARQGDPAPIEGTNFGGLNAVFDLGDDGSVLFRGNVTGDTVEFNDDMGVFHHVPGVGTSLVIQENLDGGSSQVEATYFLKLTDNGNKFLATLDARSRKTEIWTDAGGNGLEPVIESGPNASRIPESLGFGSQALLEEITTFTVTEGGAVVFTAPVVEDTFFSPSSLGEGLFRWRDGELRLLLDDTAVADGYEIGQQLTDYRTEVMANDAGDVVMVLSDVPLGEGGEQDQLLLALPSGGEPEVMLEKGQLLTVQTGDLPEVRRIQGFDMDDGQLGIPTFLNDAGQLLVKVFYSNGGGGMFLTRLPSSARSPARLEVIGVDSVNEEIALRVQGRAEDDISLEESTDGFTWTEVRTLQLDAAGSADADLPFSGDNKFFRVVVSP